MLQGEGRLFQMAGFLDRRAACPRICHMPEKHGFKGDLLYSPHLYPA